MATEDLCYVFNNEDQETWWFYHVTDAEWSLCQRRGG